MYFGIDLGTSNCSVSYVVAAQRKSVSLQAKVVEFPHGRENAAKSCRFPSVIAKKGTERDPRKAAYGFDALAANQFRLGETVFRSIKSHLGTLRSYVRAYTPQLNSPLKAWAHLMRKLCDLTVAQTSSHLDPRKNPTILTVPASFNLQQRQETLDAAEAAGFARAGIRLIDEPVAALIDWLSDPEAELVLKTGGWTHVLVVDFGGGTCDLSLVAVRHAEGSPLDLEIRNLAISPYRLLGGDTIDLAVMAEIWPQIEALLGTTRGALSGRDRKLIEDANRDTCRRLKERLCDDLARLDPADRKRQAWGRLAVRELLRRVTLSDGREVGGRVELSAHAFRGLMQPFLAIDGRPFQVHEGVWSSPLPSLIRGTLELAELEPAQLDVILLHGGSCKNPLVRDCLEAMLGGAAPWSGCRVAQTPDLDTSVARGAARHAYYLHHQQHWLVRPIVPEDLGIVTTGDVCEVLVPAGTPLPFPATGWHPVRDRFFLASPGQKRMLLPVFTGQAPDGYWPRVADSRSYELPPGLPQSHPVEVNLRIDEDKMTQWRFKAQGDYPWTEVRRIEDPWVRQAPASELEQLLAVRSRIREHVDQGLPVPLHLRTDEAYRAAQAGLRQEGLALIEAVVQEQPDSPDAWNIQGLILSMLGENRRRAECYRQASQLAPSNAVFRGNYGTALCDLGQYQQAVMEMRGALAMDASLRYLHSWLATAFERLNQTDEAKMELNRGLESARRQTAQQPEYLPAWRDLEALARRLGQYAEADEAQRKVVQLNRSRHYGGSPEDLLAGRAHG